MSQDEVRKLALSAPAQPASEPKPKTKQKELSNEQARTLLLHQKLHTPAREGVIWPLEADRELLLQAVTKKKPKVQFSNGRVFNIKYATRAASIAWGEYDVCFISPDDDTFVPCGWFHIKFLLKSSD